MPSTDPITLTAECLCKAHIFTTQVPRSQLPLKASVLFCGTCSTPMFFNNPQNPEDPGVFTGCLRNIGTDILRFESHIFVGDTVDGGASVWLQHPNADGSVAKRYAKRSDGEELPPDWPDPSSMAGFDARSEQESLPIHCRCKGVDFRLHRSDYLGKRKEEIPWFIDDKNGKMIASFDACDSCRLQAGIDLFYWTFAEMKNISFRDGVEGKFPGNIKELAAAVDAGDERMGTLGYYQSSPDVHRYFCKTCSAVIFFASDRREEVVDIAVGVLDSADGARAEGFLSWTLGGPVSWAKDFKGGWREGMLERVVDEAEKWRVGRGYPKNRRRIESEEMAGGG
ncbi:hypothetical protein FKW77_006800 [Venturia effusa]|uniref:Uncharacterized protein n=1 Tax=Venturia effusa TaxID=50376 RepID=A0A517LDZ6_9PEZI|nr:hypothetical protein FKW77_006800 [Venturia effusa]